jgi:hypothetical protein
VKKLSIDLEDDEYLQALTKKGNRTCREIYLGALGIECKERSMGRPSFDEVERNYKSYLERCAEAQKKIIRDQMIVENRAFEKRLKAEG